ncbi:MAG: cytidylate kinase family protein [Aigarchaeota archaeon]|nr:cytidylate kinase family protein [Aigarchaeota archaeon]MCX8193071.1 cytidylate kinase family protein [Nitrososphaeria archaeon]MDW7986920.1 cytidylate kinase family protein [Nitrososphaerota archaeon]
MKKVVICISGFAVTGKSTLGRKIAQAFNLKYVSGGDGLKMLAQERGYRPSGRDWWETEEGMKFLEERKANLEFDKLVDQKLMEYAEKGRVVIDSWVLPWLYRGGFNIWLRASDDVRVKRLVKRSHVDLSIAYQLLKKRDEESAEIYRKLYGIEIGKDYSPFHLILDTSNLNASAVYRIVAQAIKEYYKIKTIEKKRC